MCKPVRLGTFAYFAFSDFSSLIRQDARIILRLKSDSLRQDYTAGSVEEAIELFDHWLKVIVDAECDVHKNGPPPELIALLASTLTSAS